MTNTIDTTKAAWRVQAQGAGSFLPIQIISLQVDSVTEFEIFVRSKPDETPVLYRAKDLAFTEDALQRLAENKITHLYIRSSDERAYHRYMQQNLSSILSRPDIDKEVKSVLLYDSAQSLVKEIMQDPRSGEAIRRSKNLVETTVSYLYAERDAFEHLLKVTSFDYYTYTHSVNVFVFSVTLAQRVGLGDPEHMRDFGDGVLLHDVGKSMLDPAIINCRGKLSKKQWESMKLHPVHGYEILRRQGALADAALDVVRHHHEKLQGGGYPDGLQGDQIGPWVRICTICDIFDALTSKRSYKPAMQSFPALALMKDEMLNDLDREYFRAFVDMMGHPSAT